MQRITFNKVAYSILLSYLIISCFMGYVIIRNRTVTVQIEEEKYKRISVLAEEDPSWNPWGEEFENEAYGPTSYHEAPSIQWNLDDHSNDYSNGTTSWRDNSKTVLDVEVWGKAAIGLYLWEHILEASLEERMGGIWSLGTKTVNNIRFTFRTGPGVVIDKVPQFTENLLLILNGRDPTKVAYAKTWLDSLGHLSNLRNVGLVLLGNEQCNNSWIQPYMVYNGGPVKFVFLVYDSADIDNVYFYQWPLGVATNFPKVDSSKLPLHKKRKSTCNFLGTIYQNSSRETLMKVIQGGNFQESCHIKPRNSWLPVETHSSMNEYIQSLSQSDLTLNPVGQNTECYRIYEAIAYGSVPVVEDVMTPGVCGKSKASATFPLRLLKESDCPVIYVKDWSQLTDILENEKHMTHSEKVKRRRNLLMWYENFKVKTRQRLTSVINKVFWGVNR